MAGGRPGSEANLWAALEQAGIEKVTPEQVVAEQTHRTFKGVLDGIDAVLEENGVDTGALGEGPSDQVRRHSVYDIKLDLGGPDPRPGAIRPGEGEELVDDGRWVTGYDQGETTQ